MGIFLMNKLKSQVLVVTILALLILAAPFLSPSFRSIYLYFVINFLIVALGAEAGLLAAFSKPLEEKKQSLSFSQNTLMLKAEKGAANSATTGGNEPTIVEEYLEKEPKVVLKYSVSEKIVIAAEMDKVKRGPSIPTIFFIGGGGGGGENSEEDKVEEEYEGEEVGGLNGQELFAKTEAFIGNFYKQLAEHAEGKGGVLK